MIRFAKLLLIAGLAAFWGGVFELTLLFRGTQTPETTSVDALGSKKGTNNVHLTKPATPPKHLVSYFVVVDSGYVLLVDHKNAQRWLPTGGHVEPGEHPRATVAREVVEELGFTTAPPVGPPLMVTVTTTGGVDRGHTDVSLWYLVPSSRQQPITFDKTEFNTVQWFEFDNAPFHNSDPHLKRFITKLRR